MLAAARILLIFAHPDDESFIAAGLARRYADRGATMSLVTATRGDAGRVGEPPLCRREELAALREKELRTAAGILGISEVHLLDYRDKHLAEAPAGDIRDALAGRMRRFRPHVVVSFDPNGMNGHADHVAISRFTLDAAAAAAEPHWTAAGAQPHRVQRLLWNSPVLPWEVRREPGVDAAGGPAAGAGRRLRGRRGGPTGGEGGGATRAPHAERANQPLLLQ